MIKSRFEEIARKEKGKFYYKDEKYLLSSGSTTPNVSFLLKVDHGPHQIILDNQTGTSFAGKVRLKVGPESYPISFELSTISHLKNLFLRRKNLFTVSSENENIKYFVNHEENMQLLQSVARSTAFRPFIHCREKEGQFLVVIEYHLEFDDWTQVVQPLIGFCRNLADIYDQNLAHLNFGQFKSLIDNQNNQKTS